MVTHIHVRQVPLENIRKLDTVGKPSKQTRIGCKFMNGTSTERGFPNRIKLEVAQSF